MHSHWFNSSIFRRQSVTLIHNFINQTNVCFSFFLILFCRRWVRFIRINVKIQICLKNVDPKQCPLNVPLSDRKFGNFRRFSSLKGLYYVNRTSTNGSSVSLSHVSVCITWPVYCTAIAWCKFWLRNTDRLEFCIWC